MATTTKKSVNYTQRGFRHTCVENVFEIIAVLGYELFIFRCRVHLGLLRDLRNANIRALLRFIQESNDQIIPSYLYGFTVIYLCPQFPCMPTIIWFLSVMIHPDWQLSTPVPNSIYFNMTYSKLLSIMSLIVLIYFFKCFNISSFSNFSNIISLNVLLIMISFNMTIISFTIKTNVSIWFRSSYY